MALSLDRTYFMSVATWTEYGYTDKNTDTKKMLPIIYAVQRNRIEPVIGTTLYNKLVDDIPDDITGIYETLLKEYIVPCMIAYCDWKATYHTTYQITNKTTGANSDEHIQANNQDQNNDLRNELARDAKTYERRLKAWLCDNWENIPELYQAVDADMLRQTIAPNVENDNDLDDLIGIV